MNDPAKSGGVLQETGMKYGESGGKFNLSERPEAQSPTILDQVCQETRLLAARMTGPDRFPDRPQAGPWEDRGPADGCSC